MRRKMSVDKYINLILASLDARGFFIEQDPDLNRWRRCLEGMPGIVGINPSFDPAHHDFEIGGPQYWLRLSTIPNHPAHQMRKSSELAAVIAFRLIDTGKEGWTELLRSGRLFSSRFQPLGTPKILQPRDCNWTGKIGHHGGLVVGEAYRRQRLAYLLTHLIRAISIKRYDVDHHCGLVYENLYRSGIPLRADGYGYARADLAMDGFIGAVGRSARMYTTQIDRAGMLAQIEEGPLMELLEPEVEMAA